NIPRLSLGGFRIFGSIESLLLIHGEGHGMTEQPTAIIDIEIVPVEDESDDLDTIGAADEALAEARQMLIAQARYQVTDTTTEGQRGGGVLEVLMTLVQQGYEHREVLSTLLGSLVAGLTALRSWRRVKRIEISRGSETMVIEDVDRATAERMVAEFDK